MYSVHTRCIMYDASRILCRYMHPRVTTELHGQSRLYADIDLSRGNIMRRHVQ